MAPPMAPTMAGRREGPASGRGGSVAPLIVGLALVLALAVVVVVDASAAYLHRQGLATVADGAALAGADGGAEADEVYLSGVPEDRLALRADRARGAVADHLAAAGARERYPGLDDAVRVDGDRVVVEVRAPLELPLTVPGGPERPLVRADAAVITPGWGDPRESSRSALPQDRGAGAS